MRGKERVEPLKLDKPINYVNSKGITEDIWEGVVDIYDSVFAPGLGERRPTFTKLLSIYTPNGGELTCSPVEYLNRRFEVRTKISGPELYLRFKAYISSSSMFARHAEKRDEFQDKVEEYLISSGLQLIPHTEIC
jgi:hypothetical protein